MNIINYQEGLNPEIIQELQRIQYGTGITKRLIRELYELQNDNAYITVEYNSGYTNMNNYYNNAYVLTINVVLDNTDDLITFEICRDYPFKPPKNIKINYKDYKSLLRINSSNTMKHVKELYAKFYKISLPDCCLCCSSITCFTNWSPAIKLTKVVEEIQTLKKIRRAVINKLLAYKIINKYLIDDKGFHKYFNSFLYL